MPLFCHNAEHTILFLPVRTTILGMQNIGMVSLFSWTKCNKCSKTEQQMNKTAFLNLYVETSQPQNTENLETDVKKI